MDSKDRPLPADDDNPYRASETPSAYEASDGAPEQHRGARNALIFAILGLVCCLPLCIVAIVLGHRALREIDFEPARYTNRGAAVGALVVGYIGIGLFALGFVAQVLLVAVSG